MCEFMGVLKVNENLVKRTEENEYSINDYKNRHCRIFEPIPIREGIWLSIQASYGHYCKPRQTLLDLDDYTHWEFALFNEEDFISIEDALPELRSLAELETYFDGSVYPYVPSDLVEEVYLAFK